MRGWIRLPCLLSTPPNRRPEDHQAIRLAKTEQYQAVLAEIASDDSVSVMRPHDLPEAVRGLIENWTKA
ncbi:hypothetical protein [Microvirga aerophila]|uniref:Uncharacterized protein n=1 Tax=Microvirga aerophila TaxID=670291 RepID=A0A512BX49_9HYPH|nr:hypothetical protein [Microvirga aerophila]GEO16427.1 hypothetical protein MAE02_41230 [Microvirga aerophila]